METSGESASAQPKTTNDKPVIARIRRKPTQTRLQAFWMEINETTLKQPLLDFEKLSISDSSGKEEIKGRKVFLQHVETVTTSEVTIDIVKLFTRPAFAGLVDGKTKSEEYRSTFKEDNALVKNVRFEQIRSKKANREKLRNNALQEICRFYDIVHVDVEEQSNEVRKDEDAFMKDYMPKRDDYVYDYLSVQVDDDNFCCMPDESEYDDKDSNDNPQMDCTNESSSSPTKPTNEKLVIARVKRKATQACLDALWLEIKERPLKRPLLDSKKLSFSDSSVKDEIKSRKVLVQHMETVATSKDIIDIVKLFTKTNSADVLDGKTKSEERRCAFKKNNSRDLNLSKARQHHEALSENARFEQIWRSRKANKKEIHDKTLLEKCQFYDIVRVDLEDKSNEVQKQGDKSVEDHMPKQDDFVYDYYTVNNDINVNDKVASNLFPWIQVDEEEFWYDSDGSEYDSEDSNAFSAEDNSQNYYPNEMSDEEEDSNADDFPRNNHPNEMFDEEDDSNAEDDPRNYYPNETSCEDEDSNAKDYPSAVSDEEGDSNIEDYPRNGNRNEMHTDEDEEEEVGVEITGSDSERFPEDEKVSSNSSSIPSNDEGSPGNDCQTEDGRMENQIFDESDSESEDSCSIASRDVEQISDDGIYYDDSHCYYYDNDDDDDDDYDDHQDYSDGEDW